MENIKLTEKQTAYLEKLQKDYEAAIQHENNLKEAILKNFGLYNGIKQDESIYDFSKKVNNSFFYAVTAPDDLLRKIDEGEKRIRESFAQIIRNFLKEIYYEVPFIEIADENANYKDVLNNMPDLISYGREKLLDLFFYYAINTWNKDLAPRIENNVMITFPKGCIKQADVLEKVIFAACEEKGTFEIFNEDTPANLGTKKVLKYKFYKHGGGFIIFDHPDDARNVYDKIFITKKI